VVSFRLFRVLVHADLSIRVKPRHLVDVYK
jgi:hypothetical protein